jgi:hypothetical protein
MAATLLDSYYIDHLPEGRFDVLINNESRPRLIEIFVNNVLPVARNERFWDLALPSRILKTATQASPEYVKRLFSQIQQHDPKLDRFVQAVFFAGSSSAGGDYYEMNEAANGVAYTKFCSINDFKKLAESRLSDSTLIFPARAAWMAVASGKKIFHDGRVADF